MEFIRRLFRIFAANFDEILMRRELNNTNGAKKMTETFGRSNIFATLSLSLSPHMR